VQTRLEEVVQPFSVEEEHTISWLTWAEDVCVVAMALAEVLELAVASLVLLISQLVVN